MDVSTGWKLLWVALGTGALVTLKSAFVQGLAVTGKVRSSAGIAQHPGAALLKLELKKSCWTWFYLIGSCLNAALLLLALFAQENPTARSVLRTLQSTTDGQIRINSDTIVFLGLFAFHTTRRFVESLLITEFGDSTMHISAFLLGCIHYVGVAPSVLSDPDASAQHEESLWRRAIISTGTVLFVVASYHQSLCNLLIARLKKRNRLQHVIPHGDWFDSVRCPLYAAEVLLYLSFVLVVGGANVSMYFIFVWVLLNQTVSAKFNSDWYDRKFRSDERENLPKWVMLPGVW
ncbi:putative 3-oxo-5-alpha-steroid 4-dehydrogenase/steroid 5-alpha-reductase [Globisporangium polare]